MAVGVLNWLSLGRPEEATGECLPSAELSRRQRKALRHIRARVSLFCRRIRSATKSGAARGRHAGELMTELEDMATAADMASGYGGQAGLPGSSKSGRRSGAGRRRIDADRVDLPARARTCQLERYLPDELREAFLDPEVLRCE